MKINQKLRELVKSTPKNKITKYDADITRFERMDVIASMKENGFDMIADNDEFMKFAKVDRILGVMTTVCEYTD